MQVTLVPARQEGWGPVLRCRYEAFQCTPRGLAVMAHLQPRFSSKASILMSSQQRLRALKVAHAHVQCLQAEALHSMHVDMLLSAALLEHKTALPPDSQSVGQALEEWWLHQYKHPLLHARSCTLELTASQLCRSCSQCHQALEWLSTHGVEGDGRPVR